MNAMSENMEVKNGILRFGIMGAGNIAAQFCDAVEQIEDAQVRAVSSKCLERAAAFAEKNGVPLAFDSYEEMLKSGEVDAVYIAATTNFHYELAMLCLDYKMPVLCEKAMFTSKKEAENVFNRSRELGVFVMEGMWSRFLPKTRTAKQWIQEGKIGDLVLGEIAIGFRAPQDMENRYYHPALGGGAMYDLLVYCYEIMTDLVGKPVLDTKVQASWAKSGVDEGENVLLQFDGCTAVLQTSFAANLDDHAYLYGTKGKIYLPHPHYGNDCWLYAEGEEPVHFEDTEFDNGFVYEIREVIRCIREGKIESPVVPHALTLETTELYDSIWALKPQG